MIADHVFGERFLPRPQTAIVLVIIVPKESHVPCLASTVTDIGVCATQALVGQRSKFDEAVVCKTIANNLPDRILLDVAERNICYEWTRGHRTIDLDREDEVSAGARRPSQCAEVAHEAGML